MDILPTLSLNFLSSVLWRIAELVPVLGKRRRFGRIFGSAASRGALHVAVGALVPPVGCDEKGNVIERVLSKKGVPGSLFSAMQVVSCCEVRAATYLIESAALNAGHVSILSTDEDIATKEQLSFVSFGLADNLKTLQLLANAANSFVDFESQVLVSKLSRKLLAQNVAPVRLDHGLILKIRPSSNPEQTWICCAGLHEWGTSGAAWYLANRWRDLHAKFGTKPFAVIVKVKWGHDESAEPILMAGTPEEIERHVREA